MTRLFHKTYKTLLYYIHYAFLLVGFSFKYIFPFCGPCSVMKRTAAIVASSHKECWICHNFPSEVYSAFFFPLLNSRHCLSPPLLRCLVKPTKREAPGAYRSFIPWSWGRLLVRRPWEKSVSVGRRRGGGRLLWPRAPRMLLCSVGDTSGTVYLRCSRHLGLYWHCLMDKNAGLVKCLFFF